MKDESEADHGCDRCENATALAEVSVGADYAGAMSSDHRLCEDCLRKLGEWFRNADGDLVTDGEIDQSADEIPQCAHSLGHHWVGGRVEERKNGIAIVSRQCRNCGYEQEIPKENQMEMVRADAE